MYLYPEGPTNVLANYNKWKNGKRGLMLATKNHRNQKSARYMLVSRLMGARVSSQQANYLNVVITEF